jgi:hypothetical protein
MAKLSLSLFAAAIAFTLAPRASADPGDLYVSDLATNSIIVYKPDGTSSTFASGLNSPQGLAYNLLAKSLYVADGGSGNVFKYTVPGGVQSLVASGFSNPVGIAFNGLDLLVSESTADVVTRVAPNGNKTVFPVTVTTPLGVTSVSTNQVLNVYVAAANGALKVAPDGTATTLYSGDDSRFAQDDADGNDFLSLGDTGSVLKIPAAGGSSTTFGSGLNDPHGLAFRPKKFNGDTDGVGNLFVADPTGGFIFQITPDGTKTTFASAGQPNYLAFETGAGAPTPTPTPTPSPSPTPTPTLTPSPTPGLLRNISTRDDVLTGDNVLIGGFIITGGTSPKTVAIRGIGPSLPVTGALADPVLALNMPDGSVVTNDNWKDNSAADQAIINANGLAPGSDLESVIVATLAPVDPNVTGSGLYTAIVSGANNGTGVALMEVYDLGDPLTTTSQLANISTRGFVSTGDNVMIGGFISGPGNNDGKVLTRGLGPSLTDAGVPGALADPTLELFDGNGNSLAFNDNWQDTAGDEILATGLAPGKDAESAILTVQAAGNYTFIIRGVNDTTGVGLVEAYHLPATSTAAPSH